MTAILGLSAYYHDSAAALVVDGRIVAAAQEERFSRKKHDHEFPTHAVRYCLGAAGLAPGDLDYVGFYDKPLLKFDRLLETYLSVAPAGLASFREAMPLWIKQKLHLPREMSKALDGAYTRGFVFTEHHESHAASAFFPSPFEEAAILTMDGVGEWATASFGTGRGNTITLTHELRFPHSLGLLYSAFTYYCGFEVNEGEYKLMGLAPYGRPRYESLITDHLLDLKPDGSFRMDMSYFNYCQGLTMTSGKFHDLFGGPPRGKGEVTERFMDIAASIQKVTEDIVIRMARHVHATTGMKHLCLAGGVALNCVANGRLRREGPFDNVWVQPAAGDAGGALGVALFIWHQLLERPRTVDSRDSQRGSLLGPSFSDDEIKAYLDAQGAVYTTIPDDDELHRTVANCLVDGQVVGFVQGAMEFGPRALGSRSLLGDARNPMMQSDMNLKVKYRESFRPFAPAVLREHVHEWFATREADDSPYMLFVAPVNEAHRRTLTTEEEKKTGIDKLMVLRSSVPAITHVDYSARIQTVDRERHGHCHGVIDAFNRMTGCPVVVNTSFNLGWEPIVCSPEDAYLTFMASEIDALNMGHHLLIKAQQPAEARVRASAGLAGLAKAPWQCPCDGGALVVADGSLHCGACGGTFGVVDNVPDLTRPHASFGDAGDMTRTVVAFHDAHPHPRYDTYDSLRALIDVCRKDRIARLLDEHLPHNIRILDAGCGTGHLTNFLGLACREVIGIDMSRPGLLAGEQFRQRYRLHRVRFAQANLLQAPLMAEQFDAVVCHRVLPHVADPGALLGKLWAMTRPGGHIVATFVNGMPQWFPGGSMATPSGHPYTKPQSTGAAMRLLAEAGFDVLRVLPAPGRDEVLSAGALFTPGPSGSALSRLAAQWRESVSAGGFGDTFMVVARRPDAASTPAERQA